MLHNVGFFLEIGHLTTSRNACNVGPYTRAGTNTPSDEYEYMYS